MELPHIVARRPRAPVRAWARVRASQFRAAKLNVVAHKSLQLRAIAGDNARRGGLGWQPLDRLAQNANALAVLARFSQKSTDIV